jgi:hypothetical protein
VLVQALVDRGGHDGHVGVVPVKVGEPFGAGEQADEAQRRGVGRLDAVDGGDGRIARGEHGVADEHVAILQAAGHLEVVLDGL